MSDHPFESIMLKKLNKNKKSTISSRTGSNTSVVAPNNKQEEKKSGVKKDTNRNKDTNLCKFTINKTNY